MQALEFKPKRILVPTDFSPSANTALNTAAGLASELGAAIYLLNVIPMLPIDAESGCSAIFPEAKYLEYSRRYATDEVLTSTEALHDDGIEQRSALRSETMSWATSRWFSPMSVPT
jgi:nucleotide-binding universal stress UspA family protein